MTMKERLMRSRLTLKLYADIKKLCASWRKLSAIFRILNSIIKKPNSILKELRLDRSENSTYAIAIAITLKILVCPKCMMSKQL